MSPPATLLIWFQLRSPELAEDFEQLMRGDRDIVHGSLDTMSNWRKAAGFERELRLNQGAMHGVGPVSLSCSPELS